MRDGKVFFIALRCQKIKSRKSFFPSNFKFQIFNFNFEFFKEGDFRGSKDARNQYFVPTSAYSPETVPDFFSHFPVDFRGMCWDRGAFLLFPDGLPWLCPDRPHCFEICSFLLIGVKDLGWCCSKQCQRCKKKVALNEICLKTSLGQASQPIYPLLMGGCLLALDKYGITPSPLVAPLAFPICSGCQDSLTGGEEGR